MIKSYYHGGYPLIWLQTAEYSRAKQHIHKELQNTGVKIYSWDISNGGVLNDDAIEDTTNPTEIIKFLEKCEQNTAVIAYNFHWFLQDPEVVQALLNSLGNFEAHRKLFIVVAPVLNLPAELTEYFVVTDLELPGEKWIREVIDELKTMDEETGQEVDISKTHTPAEIDEAVKMTKGLTEFGAKNAISLSLATKGKLDPKTIFEQKCQMVKKSDVLEIRTNVETFDDIGGLDNLKDYTLNTSRSRYSKGVLIMGVPGTGKSLICKALSNTINRPYIRLDMGKVFSSLVGSSEEKIRGAIKVAEAVKPAIIHIDEIEKAVSGSTGSGNTDGGTTARVFGTFLSWLQDREPGGLYIMATANKIELLPPEFFRAGRWDALFFVGLPNIEEQKAILNIHSRKYDLNEEPGDITGWTGAEIETLCRVTAMFKENNPGFTMKDGMRYVSPLCKTAAKQIKDLQEWAEKRTIPATSQKFTAFSNARAVRIGGGNGSGKVN